MKQYDELINNIESCNTHNIDTDDMLYRVKVHLKKHNRSINQELYRIHCMLCNEVSYDDIMKKYER